MNLFRSEEHVARWLAGRVEPAGESIAAATLWELADAWYRDRLAPDWRPRTPDENREIRRRIGLTSPFWGGP